MPGLCKDCRTPTVSAFIPLNEEERENRLRKVAKANGIKIHFGTTVPQVIMVTIRLSKEHFVSVRQTVIRHIELDEDDMLSNDRELLGHFLDEFQTIVSDFDKEWERREERIACQTTGHEEPPDVNDEPPFSPAEEAENVFPPEDSNQYMTR